MQDYVYKTMSNNTLHNYNMIYNLWLYINFYQQHNGYHETKIDLEKKKKS